MVTSGPSNNWWIPLLYEPIRSLVPILLHNWKFLLHKRCCITPFSGEYQKRRTWWLYELSIGCDTTQSYMPIKNYVLNYKSSTARQGHSSMLCDNLKMAKLRFQNQASATSFVGWDCLKWIWTKDWDVQKGNNDWECYILT